MGISLNFISLEVILFRLPFTSQFQLITNPDSPFRMCPESSHFSPLSHYSSLIYLKLGHPSNALLFSLLLPLFPYQFSSNSQNDHANPFRSWIIHSISNPSHSALALMAACFPHQAPSLRASRSLNPTPSPKHINTHVLP